MEGLSKENFGYSQAAIPQVRIKSHYNKTLFALTDDLFKCVATHVSIVNCNIHNLTYSHFSN